MKYKSSVSTINGVEMFTITNTKKLLAVHKLEKIKKGLPKIIIPQTNY